MEQGEREKRSLVKCTLCLKEKINLMESFAKFKCFSCDLNLCSSCSRDHENHKCVELNSEEYVQAIKRLWEAVKEETNTEKRFREKKAEVYDRIYVGAERDRGDCIVTGICILKHSSLVVCDEGNCCIKLFDLRNHSLQHYIQLSSPPYSVTEVKGAGDGVIAVTVPETHEIVFWDFTSKQPIPTKVTKTKNPCFTIDSSSDKICAVCITVPKIYLDTDVRDSKWKVYIMSSDGDIIRSLKSDILYHGISNSRLSASSRRYQSFDPPHVVVYPDRIYWRERRRDKISDIDHDGETFYTICEGAYSHLSAGYQSFDPPHIAVLPNRIYLTERRSDKISGIYHDGETFYTVCKGTLAGICADKAQEKLYVCTKQVDEFKNVFIEHDSALKCQSDVLKFELDYRWGTRPLCYYKSLLFVAHSDYRHSFKNDIMVLRLL